MGHCGASVGEPILIFAASQYARLLVTLSVSAVLLLSLTSLVRVVVVAAACLLLFASYAEAQSNKTISLPNPFSGDARISDVRIKSQHWQIASTSGSRTLRFGDTLHIEVSSAEPKEEMISIFIQSDKGLIERTVSLKPSILETSATPAFYVSPVWPNPAKDQLSFNLYGLNGRVLNAYLYDLLGKEIAQMPIVAEGPSRLMIPAVPEGRYYFLVRDGIETLCMQEIKIVASK